MKNFLYLSILSLVIISCGGSKDEPSTEKPPIEEVNTKPSIPELVYPTNNLLCINNTLEFKWKVSTDDEGDAISYQVEVSKDNQFSEVSHSEKISNTLQTFTLEKGLAYYWRVKALDSKNAESNYSNVFSLYTEGEGISNHLPFSPNVIVPVLNSEVAVGDVALEWGGIDIDGDSLTYNVYFGTENPPTTLISENLNSTTLSVTTTSATTNYYWKVDVQDDKGGKTIGQVWGFKTN